jgi:hypothetical protein
MQWGQRPYLSCHPAPRTPAIRHRLKGASLLIGQQLLLDRNNNNAGGRFIVIISIPLIYHHIAPSLPVWIALFSSTNVNNLAQLGVRSLAENVNKDTRVTTIPSSMFSSTFKHPRPPVYDNWHQDPLLMAAGISSLINRPPISSRSHVSLKDHR